MKTFIETGLTVLLTAATVLGFLTWVIRSDRQEKQAMAEKGLVYRAAGYYPANPCTCCEGGN